MKLTELQVANGIYDALRTKIVAGGYLADITAHTGPDDHAAWKAANVAIVGGGKELVEIEQLGPYKSRDKIKGNNLIISIVGRDQAGTGQMPEFQYVVDPGDATKFLKSQLSNGRYDITFEIRYITESAAYASHIEGLIASAFGIRKYVMAKEDDLTTDLERFAFHIAGSFDVSGDGYIERGIRYRALFIDIVGPEALGSVNRFEVFTVEQATTETDPDTTPKCHDLTITFV